MAEVTTILPRRPFDGQEFIDSFRIKWQFDSANDCWRRIGSVPNLPVATDMQTGLLSSKLKTLLDSIPERGGHFGIIARPLLSLPQTDIIPLYNGTIDKALVVKSGTQIISAQPGRDFAIDQYAGKAVLFKSGLLRNVPYIIFTNDARSLFLDGDASDAANGDTFQIINPSDLNPNGVILGDIILVSESLDIKCVDQNGITLAKSGGACGVDKIVSDDQTVGLDFSIDPDFLDSLCIVIPGCRGPKGDRGDKGLPGKAGTGDGPTGDLGDPGLDAPTIPNVFTGIKIVDIDDIFDMAVVGIELDAANNRINVLKATVRTPSADTPADQVIASPINRSINFADDETFNFEILLPDIDAIGVADVDILRYPASFGQPSSGANQTPSTQVQRVKLSAIISEIINFWEKKLNVINDEYNKVLKAYIEDKDSSARKILADLAQKVAECEFQMPIEFCLGIHPNECQGGSSPGKAFEFPLAPAIFGKNNQGNPIIPDCPPGVFGGPPPPPSSTAPSIPSAIDLGTYTIPASTIENVVDHTVHVVFPHNGNPSSSTTLPLAGYVIQWEGGSIRSSATDWMVGSTTPMIGLEARFKTNSGAYAVKKMPIPSRVFNPKEKLSVEKAYRDSTLFEKIISYTFDSPGSIDIKACLPGTDPQGAITVRVLAVFSSTIITVDTTETP